MQPARIIVFDPARRLIADVTNALDRSGIEVVAVTDASNLAAAVDGADLLLLAPLSATNVSQSLPISKWLVGDAKDAPRLAGAAATIASAGVLLAPLSKDAIVSALAHEVTSHDVELARARSLVATSLVDFTSAPAVALTGVADGFAAHDCIVWWRDGDSMVPTGARESPDKDYRTTVAAGARISAACGGVVIGGNPRRSIIAEALRSGTTEVAGLIAIVSDSGRRFTSAERSDLKAIATRLTRELTFLSSHRRLVAEGERLLAGSLHDPLTSALTRGAFEQSVTHEVAAATRRQEVLTVMLLDIVGLRRLNLTYGHRIGDEVLAQTAARIRACVRGNDPMGRIGGDELCVLLVGSNDAQATLVARKVIRKVTHDPIVADGHKITVKVRTVLTEMGAGERSGEAAFARCYASLRTAPIDDAMVVSSDVRTNDTDMAAESGLSAGTVVGGTYRVLHELSRGAMGVVYRGEDLGLGRPVAIKVLRSDLGSDRDLVSRFRAEAGLLASLHHNNLVQVYSLGEHSSDVYFVMELVEGQPLSEVLRATVDRSEWFPTPAIAQITLEIADALDAMHVRGLIHRDVKPANILLDRDRDRAVLVDVGVAVKAGDQREAAGTPGFAAPESFLETQDSPQTDVYGLAATVYSMLTGRPPFGSGPAVQVIHRQMYDALVPPSCHRPLLSSAVDAVLSKGLDPQAKKRWASASTFAIALARALERLPSVEAAPERHHPEEPVSAAAEQAASVMAPTSALSTEDLARLPAFGVAQDAPRPESDSQPAPGSRPGGNVRGAHFRVLLKILSHHLGEGALHRIALDHPQFAAVLSPSLAPMSWHDVSQLALVLDYAVTALPAVPVCRQVGRGVITATFARMFGADPSSLPIETVLTAAPAFWPRYHNWSSIAAYVDEGYADMIVEGGSASEHLCAVVAAQLERIVELAGGKGVEADHLSCTCRGDDACRYRLTWASVDIVSR